MDVGEVAWEGGEGAGVWGRGGGGGLINRF